MTLDEINILREAVQFERVIWTQLEDVITSVPLKECDPDKTGITDYVACNNKGHLDLSNADAMDFYIVKQLFVQGEK